MEDINRIPLQTTSFDFELIDTEWSPTDSCTFINDQEINNDKHDNNDNNNNDTFCTQLLNDQLNDISLKLTSLLKDQQSFEEIFFNQKLHHELLCSSHHADSNSSFSFIEQLDSNFENIMNKKLQSTYPIYSSYITPKSLKESSDLHHPCHSLNRIFHNNNNNINDKPSSCCSSLNLMENRLFQLENNMKTMVHVIQELYKEIKYLSMTHNHNRMMMRMHFKSDMKNIPILVKDETK